MGAGRQRPFSVHVGVLQAKGAGSDGKNQGMEHGGFDSEAGSLFFGSFWQEWLGRGAGGLVLLVFRLAEVGWVGWADCWPEFLIFRSPLLISS
jgi:hypothetical protein